MWTAGSRHFGFWFRGIFGTDTWKTQVFLDGNPGALKQTEKITMFFDGLKFWPLCLRRILRLSMRLSPKCCMPRDSPKLQFQCKIWSSTMGFWVVNLKITVANHNFEEVNHRNWGFMIGELAQQLCQFIYKKTWVAWLISNCSSCQFSSVYFVCTYLIYLHIHLSICYLSKHDPL